MGFWIFMTVSNLILPVLMIVLGKVFIKKTPTQINDFYGYRTRRSMKNQAAWDFSHLYCGKLWRKMGWFMLPVSMIVMIPAFGKSDDIVGAVGGVVVTAECMVMLVSILLTEKALAKQFDEEIK
jgi:uncharacterized membrane protein